MSLSNELAPLPGRSAAPGRSGPLPALRCLPQAFAHLCDRSTLPPDVMDDEVTEVICFKASLALNRLFGGQPDMTFSARAFAASDACPLLAGRCLWICVRIGADVACGVLRGEAHHCETAWVNYCRRPGKARQRG